jgi:Tol biopolymer transport system component
MALLIAGLAIWSLTPPASQALTRLVITPPPTAALASYRFTDLAVSPDGSQVIYRVEQSGVRQLYVRSMDDFLSTPIVGTEGVDRDFFFSPDGNWLAFVAADKLKKISLAGGTPITLCDAPDQGGGSWDAEDVIVFAANLGSGRGLYRVSANGGQPESIVLPNLDSDEAYYQPEVLPNGKAVLFALSVVGGEVFQIAVFSQETGEQKILIEGGRAPHYAATGHLVYERARTGTLMAAPFDLERLEVTGDSVPILEGVRQSSLGSLSTVDYVFSRSGTLAYVPAPEEIERGLVWVDRKGTETLVSEEKRNYRVPRVSPDGQSIAVTILEPDSNVWLLDLRSDSFRRFTFEGGGTHKWSPDGKWIAFSSRRDGPNHLYRKLADGSGSAERLSTDAPLATRMMGSWSPDGSVLTFDGGGDIWVLPMDGDNEPELLIPGGMFAVLSPNGQWLAYVSRERGESSVYVSRYSEPEAKWQISGEEGGREPVWSPDGTQLFYRSENRMMAVSVETEPTFGAEKPEVLFEGSYLSSESDPEFQYYDISPDGQRFLMIKEEQTTTAQINVVLNWFEELKRLVPTP